MPVENPQGHIVLVPRHEPHEEPVVPHVVRAHDDEVEEVPDPRVAHELDDELANKVVGVVAVAVQEGGDQAEELALLVLGRRELGVSCLL